MLLKLLFLLTLVLSALLLGTTFAHTLEMPAKLQYDGPLWTRLQQSLYPAFAWIGGPVELGAIGSATALAFVLRHDPGPFLLTATAALCLAIAFFGIWIFVTNAANAEIANWSQHSVPADWSEWRRQWDCSYAARFVLQLAGFIALIVALLVMAQPPSA